MADRFRKTISQRQLRVGEMIKQSLSMIFIRNEAKLPNLLPESYRTDIAIFVDSCNVWGVDYSDVVDDTNIIRSAFGISANTFTTIGTLSFTLAQDISSASTDEPQKFNFRLGTSF